MIIMKIIIIMIIIIIMKKNVDNDNYSIKIIILQHMT